MCASVFEFDWACRRQRSSSSQTRKTANALSDRIRCREEKGKRERESIGGKQRLVALAPERRRRHDATADQGGGGAGESQERDSVMAVGEALGSLGRARPTTAVVARPAPRSPSVGLLRRSGGRGIVRGGLGLAPRPRALAEPKREREKSDEEVPSTSRRGDGLDAGDAAGASDPSHGSVNDYIRSGGSERRWLLKQAAKTSQKEHRRKIGSVLKSFAGDSRGSPPDVVVVGCGPAGLALACSLAEEAERRRTGVKVGLIGPDVPFVNTYGVWEDEFADLGMSECLETVFEDAHCFFGEGAGGRVSVGRSYAKVDLEGLQNHLVDRCERAGVVFEEGHVDRIDSVEDAGARIHCKGGRSHDCALTILASGAASSRLLEYEAGVPDAGAQTAYGFEVEIDAYPFDASAMHFMDFRRHHSGIWRSKALHPSTSRALRDEGSWGTRTEVPSFLYAMPLGGNKAFFQETCLVSKDAVPFNVLKRRLETRMEALGVKVKAVLDEEWSYIPVGGPLPTADQRILAFGATANMIHPASGYSVARSLKSAPAFASDVMEIWERGGGWSEEASRSAWTMLWSDENRKCAAFHTFGMELLALMDVKSINDFFLSFFSLPSWMWKGFLSSSLDSNQLILFALAMFAVAPVHMKAKLVGHLLHPAGTYLMKAYLPTRASEDGEDL